ncbi:MAG: hypothetical protein ACRD35_06895 [Candidatus Acidiferrales bacterium]
MTKEFPPSWTIRLNEIVKTVRRQQRWIDVNVMVDHPSQPEKPPLLRLEKAGITDVVPLTPLAVRQTMVSGYQRPLVLEIKQAFMRFAKTVERQNKLARFRVAPAKTR